MNPNHSFSEGASRWARTLNSSIAMLPSLRLGFAFGIMILAAGCNSGGHECMTPLVLSFDGAPVQYTPPTSESRYFELGQNDQSLTTDWPTAHTPWLARDVDGDGFITSGAELFGSDTALSKATKAKNGFLALAALDSNGDGRIDAADDAWKEILIWTDRNQDRTSELDELETAAEAGVVSIDLGAFGLANGVPPRCDARGNCEVERSSFGWNDTSGAMQSGAVVDVHLPVFAKPDPGEPPGSGDGESPSYPFGDMCGAD